MLAWAGPVTVSAAPVLTGAGLFTADANGSWAGLHHWNTVPRDFYWNLFLTEGDATTGPFFNGPTNAAVAPSIPLMVGTHTFGLVGETPLPGSGYETGFAGLNLYLDGATTPTLSARTPTGPARWVTANAGTVPSQNGTSIPGAGTLNFSDGQFSVEIIDFRFDTNPAVVIDRVSGADVGTASGPDLYGAVTLRVTAVPEPAAVGALLAAGGLLIGRRRRRATRSA